MTDWREQFQVGNVTYDKPEGVILCDDCAKVLRKFPDESVDLILTDPPYGQEKFGDWDKFDQGFHEDWLSEANRVLKKTGQLYVFWGHLWLDAFLCMCWHDAVLYWFKPKPIINPDSKRWVAAVEHILWWHKGEEYTWNVEGNGTTLLNCFHDSLAMQKEGKSLHRCQKPESLIQKFILRSSNPDDIVLDMFLGSGTTASVAKKLGRRFIGIEINPAFCEISKQRLSQGILL